MWYRSGWYKPVPARLSHPVVVRKITSLRKCKRMITCERMRLADRYHGLYQESVSLKMI